MNSRIHLDLGSDGSYLIIHCRNDSEHLIFHRQYLRPSKEEVNATKTAVTSSMFEARGSRFVTGIKED